MSKYKVGDKVRVTETLPAEHHINHPSHYTTEGRMECIDEMIVLFGKERVSDWCKITAYKYFYRAGHKGNAEEDIKKANWYLEKAQDLDEIQDN